MRRETGKQLFCRAFGQGLSGKGRNLRAGLCFASGPGGGSKHGTEVMKASDGKTLVFLRDGEEAGARSAQGWGRGWQG